MAEALGFERGKDGELQVVADQAFAEEMVRRGPAGSAIDWVTLSLTGSYTVPNNPKPEIDLAIVHEDPDPYPSTDGAARYGRPDLGTQPNW